MKEKKCQPRIPYASKLTLENEGNPFRHVKAWKLSLLPTYQKEKKKTPEQPENQLLLDSSEKRGHKTGEIHRCIQISTIYQGRNMGEENSVGTRHRVAGPELDELLEAQWGQV